VNRVGQHPEFHTNGWNFPSRVESALHFLEALPLAMSWLVKKRKDAMSVTGWLKTGRCPLKYQTTASLS
jgi:hypothetical protein